MYIQGIYIGGQVACPRNFTNQKITLKNKNKSRVYLLKSQAQETPDNADTLM